jgi:hypothetical protein
MNRGMATIRRRSIMDEQGAIDIIYEGLVGKDSLPVKLRTGKGLDRKQLQQVKDAIGFLNERWKSQETVPKRVAAAFVDIQTAMQWGSSLYSEAEQNEIEDAANELVDLAYGLLGE